MKLKILKSVPASRDGVNIEDFRADSIQVIDETKPRAVELAQMLVRSGLAEIVTDEEATAHVKEIASLSEGERAQLDDMRTVIAQEDREIDRAAKKEKRTSKKKPAAFLAVDANVPSEVQMRLGSPQVKPPAPAANEPESDKIEVGSVVLCVERLGQRMTVVSIEGDAAECAWFVDATPHRDLFALGSLVVAPAVEK